MDDINVADNSLTLFENKQKTFLIQTYLFWNNPVLIQL